jgi:hypothetical protein
MFDSLVLMYEGLRREIEELVVPVHGDALTEVRHLLDTLTAKLARAEAEYAAAGSWAVEGYGSMAAFLRHRSRVSESESRRQAKRATRLGSWREFAEAWSAGVLTGTQVDIAVAVVPDRHVERFAANAAEIAEILSPLHPRTTRIALRDWVNRADAAAEREAAELGLDVPPAAAESELFASRSIDGLLFVSGTLDIDSAPVVETALSAALRPDAEGERRTPAQRRADALVEIARQYLARPANVDGNRIPERLTIVADIAALYRAALRGAGVRTAAQLEEFLLDRPWLGALERGLFLDGFDGAGGVARTLDGNPVSDGLLSTISSGGTLERLLTAKGRIIDHGRSIRTFTPGQRRSILVRDQGCRVAGCDAGPERCDVHHVIPWEAGGVTDVANAVAKCRHEHLRHHRERWTERLEPDGTYTVTAPDGTERTTGPPGWTSRHRLPLTTSAAAAPDVWSVPEELFADAELFADEQSPAEIEHMCRLARERVRELVLGA